MQSLKKHSDFHDIRNKESNNTMIALETYVSTQQSVPHDINAMNICNFSKYVKHMLFNHVFYSRY